MIFRLALAADAFELARVENTRPQAAGWGENGFESEIRQERSFVWCACEGERIVGFLALRAACGFCEILNVAVEPQAAGRGVGFALLSRALDALKKESPFHVTLEVAQDNIPALALYAKAGFKALGRRKDFYAKGRDGLIMGVDL